MAIACRIAEGDVQRMRLVRLEIVREILVACLVRIVIGQIVFKRHAGVFKGAGNALLHLGHHGQVELVFHQGDGQ